MRKNRSSPSFLGFVVLVGIGIWLFGPKGVNEAQQAAGAMASHAAAAVTSAPTATPAPTAFQKHQFGSYKESFFMFGQGWWKDEVRFTEAYIMMDTIKGRTGFVWLFVDDVAWTTGLEVFFDQSLLAAGVKYGDILHAYCEGIEPYQKWGREDGRSIILESWNRARCHYFEILPQAEKDRIYNAVRQWVY